MRRLIAIAVVCFVVFGALASHACAHYLWVTIDAKSGEHGTTNIYFEGGPGLGDGKYLDPFVKRGKTWIRTAGQSKPKLLEVADTKKGKKRWLSGPLASPSPRSIDSYGKFGVYRYGDTPVLLHYYGRHLDVADHDDLHELARAEQLALDIVPHDEEGALQLQVLWQGKPVSGRTVAIRGPGGFKENLKTDESGSVRFEPQGKGRYTFRTNIIEKDERGTDDGEAYEEVRHHATLVMKLPLGV